ncbi:MAG: TIGR00341 family protein [Lewinella sp.]|nr:TIGR00341 family protein [Lewinella sp.]
MAKQTASLNTLLRYLRLFLKDRFNLEEGKASEKATIEDIEKGVVFRGPNLWILMFAIMVASVGLNVNSPAVIIGAMLISPLMGPIMGIGLGVGIYDFELIIKALRNLGIAVGISVLTSALYFWISPLNDARSELLARTSPTLWDVMIALFGGLAGIVAGSRKEKSNAIPGVAIATALMPPLCTAGFGLATGQWNYFFGAFYLFFINSVFISFSTYLIVRLLGFKSKNFDDATAGRERRVKRYIYILVFLTIIPSVYTAYTVVNQSLFEQNANLFVNQELKFDNCQIINRQYIFENDQKRIEVTFFGEPVGQDLIQKAQERLVNYRNLHDAVLVVHQGYTGEEGVKLETVEQMSQQMRTGIIEDLYQKNQDMLKDKDERIKFLEDRILQMREQQIPVTALAEEVKAINKNVQELSISRTVISGIKDSLTYDTVYLAYAKFARTPRRSERAQIEDWLKARVKADTIKLVVN